MQKKIIKYFKNLFYRIRFHYLDLSISERQTILFFISTFFIICAYIFFQTPPRTFPVGKVFTVNPGESLQEITDNLYSMDVIRSKFTFRSTVILLGGEKKVIAGDYLLDKKEGPSDLAYRLTKGRFHLEVVRAIIQEGWNVFEIGDYLEKSLLNFDKVKFVSLAKAKEGYLFPDTYFVSPTVKPEDIIERMVKNFNDKIPEIPGLATTTYKFKDVLTMASIVEREARTMDSRKIIAGILWKRLKMGMPLQVDSSFEYVNGKNTFELSLLDLKIDSPYNTYKYKGLPPGPIGNPGVDSILATINPTTTKYLYFLTGKDGKMYYAKTFDEHVRNKQKYLW